MDKINISTDIIPIGELKKRLSQYLTNVHTSGQPLVITQNGRPAGVLISPSDYDELVYNRSFIESVHRGLSDVKAGRTHSTAEIKENLQKRRASR